MHPGLSKKLLENCAAGQIFCETKCAVGKTYQTKCAAGQNFLLSPNGLLIQYVIYFPQITTQNLLFLINE